MSYKKNSNCPKCGAEISKLLFCGSIPISGELIGGKRSQMNYENVDMDASVRVNGFSCPECGVELFDNLEDAEDFLS